MSHVLPIGHGRKLLVYVTGDLDTYLSRRVVAKDDEVVQCPSNLLSTKWDGVTHGAYGNVYKRIMFNESVAIKQHKTNSDQPAKILFKVCEGQTPVQRRMCSYMAPQLYRIHGALPSVENYAKRTAIVFPLRFFWPACCAVVEQLQIFLFRFINSNCRNSETCNILLERS